MALSDQLNGKTEQHLIDDGVFINALVGKLAAGAGATGIYTKQGVDDELAKKADTAALANKADKNYVDTELGKKANTADVYTKTAADTAFATIDASNLTEAANKKAFAEAILPAKDGDKSILVDKLGEFLDNSTDNKYGAKSDQTAKAFLADKYPFAKTDGSNIDKDFAGKVFDVTDGAAANPKNIAETKLGTTFAKINASNLTEAANKKAFAEAILPAKEGDKSVLVDRLGEFLDSSDKAKYDGKIDQIAKMFLGGKGLKGDKGGTGLKGADGAQGPKGDQGDTGPKGDAGLKGADGAQGPKGDQGYTGPKGNKGDTGPKGADGINPSAAEIAADPVLQQHIAKISLQSPEFKQAVQEEMSQPSFDIPTSDDAALNWTW